MVKPKVSKSYKRLKKRSNFRLALKSDDGKEPKVFNPIEDQKLNPNPAYASNQSDDGEKTEF